MFSFFLFYSVSLEGNFKEFTLNDILPNEFPVNIKKLTINRFVKTIGFEVLKNSTQTVEIVDASEAILLSRILPYAFYGCINLKRVDFSNCGLLWSIHENAFMNSGLEEIILPKSIKLIGDFAFSNSKIANISFPDSLFSIGTKCFYKTPLESVNITDNSYLAIIKAKAFSKTQLKHFFFSKNVASIEGCIFTKTPIETIELSPNNAYLTYNTVMYNKNMSVAIFVLPDYKGIINLNPNVVEILPSAFESSKATGVNMCNVEMIGNRAFYHSAIKGVKIPKSVKIVGENSFNGCSEMRKLEICGKNVVIGRGSFHNTGITCNVKADTSLIYRLIRAGISINSFFKCNEENL